MNKIGFIGGGKMADAIVKGLINSGNFNAANIWLSAPHSETLNKFKVKYNINTVLSNINTVKNSEIILLAVKPFVLNDVLDEIKPYINKNHLIISIAAGISINTIEAKIGKVPVIRVMPNTPALVNEGISAVCCGNYADINHQDIVSEIFSSVGQVVITEEKYIDIITAISGSGPAFYYYFINEIAKSGEKLGLDYNTCLKLSAQTALGSAKMILQSGINPEQLITNVTTPGGCTAEGNKVLTDNNISDILFNTIKSTAQKAFELGNR